MLCKLVFLFFHWGSHFFKRHIKSFVEPAIWLRVVVCTKKYVGATYELHLHMNYNAHELDLSNLIFLNFRMTFHDQKTPSLNFIIIHFCFFTSFCFNKIFVEHLFLDCLFVSFDLFCRLKHSLEVYCKKCVLKPTFESLFNKIAGLLGHLRNICEWLLLL